MAFLPSNLTEEINRNPKALRANIINSSQYLQLPGANDLNVQIKDIKQRKYKQFLACNADNKDELI